MELKITNTLKSIRWGLEMSELRMGTAKVHVNVAIDVFLLELLA